MPPCTQRWTMFRLFAETHGRQSWTLVHGEISIFVLLIRRCSGVRNFGLILVSVEGHSRRSENIREEQTGAGWATYFSMESICCFWCW